MYPLSIIIFFILCYGFGYLITFFVKNSEHFFERHLMRIGIGLGTFVAVGYLLNLVRIPLDYRVFLGIILVGTCGVFGHRYWKHKTLFLHKQPFNINFYVVGMLILFAITFSMYHKGAFSYPYLENDDPWGHAVGTKYVAIEKIVFAPDGGGLHYIDPYPPAYDMLMGMLHQTNTSVMWTLKFFNSLIISLGIIFFYFFSRQLFSNSKKALFATFFLFAMPAFMSHFIWALALTMPLFFVSFYCLERIGEDRGWVAPSVFVIMATLTSSPSHSVYFGLFLGVYLAAKTFTSKKFIWMEYAGAAGGALLCLILWWIPVFLRLGFSKTIDGFVGRNYHVLSISGTADRQYALTDFVYAQKANLINNPVGIGVVICAIFVFYLVYLIWNHLGVMIKHKLAIIIIFLFLFSIISIGLSSTYIKFVPKKTNPEPREPGSTPFMEFMSDQAMLLVFLAIFLFIILLLCFTSWNNPDSNMFPLLSFGWCMLAFYAVNASPFLYKLSPFRAWMVLAIPLSILSAEGLSRLLVLIKNTVKPLLPSPTFLASLSALVLIIIVYGVYSTSFIQKYAVNTAQWNPGGFWTSGEEIGGYVWMQQNLPPNTPIFSFSNPSLIIAFDKYMCWWCEDDIVFSRTKFNSSTQDIASFMKSKGYSYLIVDGQTAQRQGANKTSEKITSLLQAGFSPIHQTPGFILFKTP